MIILPPGVSDNPSRKYLMKHVESKKISKGSYIKHVLWYTVSLQGLIYLLKLYGYFIINNLHGRKIAQIGRNTKIHPTVIIRGAINVVIGSGCYFNHNTILNGGKENAKLIIGNNVQTGPNVAFYAYNHAFNNRNLLIEQQGYYEADIVIEDDVWIGANSVILAGVHIGRGVVVGAGSVVTKDLPPYSVCAGSPARVLKERID